MNISVCSKVFLALIVNSCVTALVLQKPEAQHLTPLYEAAIDLLMTCSEDPPRTIGIADDPGGLFLRTLRSKHLVPVVLIDTTITSSTVFFGPKHHKLNVFVIVSDDLLKFHTLVRNFKASIWWNPHANFLILDATPDADGQCTKKMHYLFYGIVRERLLNTQFMCFYRSLGIAVFNANPFTRYAPKTWPYLSAVSAKNVPPFYVFGRAYKKGGQNCEDLHFSKTTNIGGYPLYFQTRTSVNLNVTYNIDEMLRSTNSPREIMDSTVNRELSWFINNVRNALNASAIIIKHEKMDVDIIYVTGHTMADPSMIEYLGQFIFSHSQLEFFAITQHTSHKSQLEKILTVIDRESRIGMCVVYLVTLIFFKFFLRQAIVPAMLNLVRLTCNTGLDKLPTNVAPTIYLACLFAFVVTLQGIYTGNLASLLTTTIAYPHVNTKQDIADLGYTAYIDNMNYNSLTADANLDGRVIALPTTDKARKKCTEHVLRDPLATCIMDYDSAMIGAIEWNLHVSKDPILVEWTVHAHSALNPFGPRLEALMSSWAEYGLRRKDERVKRLMAQFVDDDDVKRNTDRRIMTMKDLGFAFIILMIGLACSLICFISELVIFRVRLKIAKRRLHARLAWEPTEKLCFSSLNFRFNARRLFSKRR